MGMIDYDDLRAEIPAREILNDIESARRLLFACHVDYGFDVRPLGPDEIRSLVASTQIGHAQLRKVMPDLKAEDLNTIKGRDRLKFITDMRRRLDNPSIGAGERRALQLASIMEALAEQRISVDEAVKISNLLLSHSDEQDDGTPIFRMIPVSDEELKNRLIRFGMIS